MNRWKTKVVEVLYGRMWFLAGMVVLMFCLSLFCSDARALYDISNTGSDHVSGLSGINARWATGPDFGTVSAEATNNDAYGLFNVSGDVEIVGNFGPAGVISATSGDQDAYGLYSYSDTGWRLSPIFIFMEYTSCSDDSNSNRACCRTIHSDSNRCKQLPCNR